jgi:hypothetical protein
MTRPSRFEAATLLVVPFALVLVACGEELGDATGSSCPSGSTLTYESFGRDFMQTYCVTCHGPNGPESPALSSLEQVQGHLSDIDRAAAAGPNAVNTFMPESGSVSEAERRQLGEWLACGAPE